MNTTLKDIRSSALQLNKKERVELIKALLESIDPNETILYEDEWMDTVKERKVNYEAGKSGSTSWRQIKKEIEQKTADSK